MITEDILEKQFEDYNKSYSIDGVRMPSVEIDSRYKKKYEIKEGSTDREILRQICFFG